MTTEPGATERLRTRAGQYLYEGIAVRGHERQAFNSVKAVEDEAAALAAPSESSDLLAAVEALRPPKRYENDRNGNWWTTDMEYGWDVAIQDVLALLRSTPASREAGLDAGLLALAMDEADPDVISGGGHEDEDHAEHLAYAKEIAAEYARLAAASRVSEETE